MPGAPAQREDAPCIERPGDIAQGNDAVEFRSEFTPRGSTLDGNQQVAASLLWFDALQCCRTRCLSGPPYVSSTRDLAQDYRFEMDDAQHEAIAGVVHELKGMFIVSGYKMPLYEELFAAWRCVTTQAYADGGLSKQECLCCRRTLHIKVCSTPASAKVA